MIVCFFSNCISVAQKFPLYFLFLCFWSELKYFEITKTNTQKKTLKIVAGQIKNNMKRLLKQARASMCHGQCGAVLELPKQLILKEQYLGPTCLCVCEVP